MKQEEVETARMQILGTRHNRFHRCACLRVHCCYTDQMHHISDKALNWHYTVRYLVGVAIGALATYLIMVSK